MWRLFYPLRYFSLVNDEKKHLDIWPTVALAVVIAVPYLFVPGVSFFKANGFLDKLLTLTAALTGFYVAALVAAATFNHPDLDKVIKSGPIALITKDVDGNKIKDYLTRREFVCTVFGYLAFATFVLSLTAAFCIGLSGINFAEAVKWPVVGVLFSGDYWLVIRGTVIAAIALLVGHVAVVTSLGLYYLMDRLYRHDRQITTPKPGAGSSEAA